MTVPNWISDRGGEVQAFDRRSADANGVPFAVGGPSHSFLEPTDLLLTNGMLRFWVGNRLVPAFLNVEAFIAGAWRAVGILDVSGGDLLLSARLMRLTTDVGVVALELRNQGTVHCALHRGERGVRVSHGGAPAVTVAVARSVRWTGTPPIRELSGVALDAAGVFESGLANGSGRARFWWPQDESVDAWSVACAWKPYASTGAAGPIQTWGSSSWGTGSWGGSGMPGEGQILSIEDSGGEVGSIHYDGALGRIVFELGAQSIQSALVSFASGDIVRAVGRFSTATGMALSTKVGAGTATHVSNAALTNPGTSESTYYALGVGPTTDGEAGGVYDQTMIFEDALTDAEAAALVAQASRTASLPDPEGRLVWLAPFDVAPAPSGSESAGRVSGGLDAWGLTRVVAALRSASSLPLGLSRTTDVFEVGAYLTTGGTQDAPVDVHAQFAADSEQELRVR